MSTDSPDLGTEETAETAETAAEVKAAQEEAFNKLVELAYGKKDPGMSAVFNSLVTVSLITTPPPGFPQTIALLAQSATSPETLAGVKANLEASSHRFFPAQIEGSLKFYVDEMTALQKALTVWAAGVLVKISKEGTPAEKAAWGLK